MSSIGLTCSNGNNAFAVYSTSSDIPAGNQITIVLSGGNDTATMYPHDAQGSLTINGTIGIVVGTGTDTMIFDDTGGQTEFTTRSVTPSATARRMCLAWAAQAWDIPATLRMPPSRVATETTSSTSINTKPARRWESTGAAVTTRLTSATTICRPTLRASAHLASTARAALTDSTSTTPSRSRTGVTRPTAPTSPRPARAGGWICRTPQYRE